MTSPVRVLFFRVGRARLSDFSKLDFQTLESCPNMLVRAWNLHHYAAVYLVLILAMLKNSVL